PLTYVVSSKVDKNGAVRKLGGTSRRQRIGWLLGAALLGPLQPGGGRHLLITAVTTEGKRLLEKATTLKNEDLDAIATKLGLHHAELGLDRAALGNPRRKVIAMWLGSEATGTQRDGTNTTKSKGGAAAKPKKQLFVFRRVESVEDRLFGEYGGDTRRGVLYPLLPPAVVKELRERFPPQVEEVKGRVGPDDSDDSATFTDIFELAQRVLASRLGTEVRRVRFFLAQEGIEEVLEAHAQRLAAYKYQRSNDKASATAVARHSG